MILSVRRASGMPILLEDSEILTLDQLEDTEDYVQLEHFEKQLIKSDALKEIKIETKKLEELLIFVQSLRHSGSITIDFQRSLVVINDHGSDINQ